MLPLAAPPIRLAYPIDPRVRPAVTLAHPMRYGVTPVQLKPLLQE